MVARQRAVDRGALRGRTILADVAREFNEARLDHDLTYREIGDAVGLSGSQVSRIARGLAPSLTIIQAARLLSVVGLDLSARGYPTGQPIRDAGHAALLERLRAQLHPTLRWRTEVPLPISGDLRAWDAWIGARGWDVAVEAETRARDLQALQRRIALKQRDGRVERVLLLLRDSRHNRDLIRLVGGGLSAQFPVPGRRAIDLLRVGADPGGSADAVL
jgi:transcriptional regulator with XRE-family HTH domain